MSAPNIPLAVHRLNVAIAQAKEYGLLGEDILGRGFNFDIELVEGAGAFVCGEETALISSLEGRAGRPRPRPPFPAKRACGAIRPTSTTSRPGSTSPRSSPRGRRGSPRSAATRAPGTKVFSLVGKVRNTGLVEMPLGTPLSKFVYDAGGGGMPGHTVKAVQTGGPSGGCIPQDMFDTPGRLRNPRQARLDHGFGRHGGDGRRQLHGRRRPLFHRVHPLGILRQVHALPGRPGQGAAHAHPHHQGRGPRGGSRRTRRTGPHDPRHLAVRARPVGARTRS